MRGAASALWTIARELAPTPAPTARSSLAALFSSHCLRLYHGPAEREKKESSYFLGPDLPDIWGAPGSVHPPPPRLQPPAGYELTPTIIDGKSVAEDVRLQIAEEICQMRNAAGEVPGLAVILVGERRDSETYVRYKIKACREVGIRYLLTKLPEGCTEDEVVRSVSSFNEDPSVHGILVQLPLPQHMDEERILSAISLQKDVDGFHPLNVGNLALRGREPLFIPCAAKACLKLLLHYGVELVGKNVAVIGRSKVVGLPTSLLLQRHHATVSIVHALTKNPDEITREADIVISAAGVANLVRGSWLKRGTFVIDVGTNPIKDPGSERGYRLAGDVCFEEAVKVASVITPVPGGVGPVTIAMLLSNTLESAKRAFGLSN